MSCSRLELEAKHGQGGCKCVRYRDVFPDCACERESVSPHSLGPVTDAEVLVRTLFRDNQVDGEGNPTPSYFRPDPTARGFSVDRMQFMDPETLKESKHADPRYDGYLMFIAARAEDIRRLKDAEKRLFCIYDSAIEDNHVHADICQNVVLPPETQGRKKRMMEIARHLRSAFGGPQSVPPTSPT